MTPYKAAMSLFAAIVMSLFLAGTVYAQDATTDENGEEMSVDEMVASADPERGKEVFERIGVCLQCHGWNGDGLGKNPRSPGRAALLRETELDNAGLVEIIECGIPGTPMPYHDRLAYTDDRCFGMTMEDFAEGEGPDKGKTFRHDDTLNLIAYLREAIIGQGETTLEDCVAFYGRADHPSCRGLE